MAVVSLDHLFLIIFSLDDDIFNPPRALRRHKTHHHGRMKMCLSVCLSVSLSLSHASWQRRANDTTKAIIAQKKGRTKKRLVGRRLTAAQKKAIKFARRVPRKEEEEDKRERVLSLLREVLRIKEIERCDFWFLPFVCVCVCVS